jgi:4-amino-4-deoxychorismate lyase
MLQFIETICFENGDFNNLPLHEERMNRTRNHFFGILEPLFLKPFLEIPIQMAIHKVKCRVTYAEKIENIEYELYNKRFIKSLKCVINETLEYSYKFANRNALTALHQMRQQCDEILIVRNGLITDTTFSNIVFQKEGIWYTPTTPLLPGIRRADYLNKRLIQTTTIRPDELHLYQEARLINAMISLEESLPIQIEAIELY